MAAAEYVWVNPLADQEVSPRFEGLVEAGEWLRSCEGQRIERASLFPMKLRAVSEGNWTRDATGAERVVAGVF